jgi:hypothetical protein
MSANRSILSRASEEEFEEIIEDSYEVKIPVERPRTANSIPNKSGYVFVKAPQLKLEYQLPNSTEKHLLPIRFPILYANVLNSIKKYNKQIEMELERRKDEESGIAGVEIF